MGNAPTISAAIARGLSLDGVLLVVDVARQRLRVLTRRGMWRAFRVSTATRGISADAGSHGTPPGWHCVASRVGTAAPMGQVFRSRRRTRRVLPSAAWRQSPASEDLILTRILRLDGLEPGVNRGLGIDSFSRWIYLHGTNHEQHLGRPASHGCVRMANRDIAALFTFIRGRKTWCWIG